MRRQIPSKSSSCTEHADVDAAGISVKAGAHYPGRSVGVLIVELQSPRGDWKRQQKSAEAILGTSTVACTPKCGVTARRRAEGPNVRERQKT